MSQATATVTAQTEEKPVPPPGLRICCACPETKKPRDECIARNGPENCISLIDAHKACLSKLGFDVSNL